MGTFGGMRIKQGRVGVSMQGRVGVSIGLRRGLSRAIMEASGVVWSRLRAVAVSSWGPVGAPFGRRARTCAQPCVTCAQRGVTTAARGATLGVSRAVMGACGVVRPWASESKKSLG